MKEIDDKLKDKSTDDQIKDLVHGICNALPGTIKDSCNKFVNQYADVIIVLLEETMEPKSICTYLKMCDPQNHPLGLVQEEVTKCGICRNAADVMQKILKNPKIDQSVEHIFEKTCRGLPSDMKKTCMHSFFKNGELDFTNVATAVSLMNDKEIVNHQITNYIECAVCKIICKITRYMCGSNFNREAVEFVLHQVCNLIAGPFRSTCEILIHQSINQIADLIIIFTDDDVVCKLVNFCPADGAIIKGIELESANVQRKFDCPICKAVVSGIKALVKSDFSQNKIKDALTKVCSKLHKFGSKCQHFVDAYAGKLVEMLTNAATRGKVCKLLKLCPAHDSLAEEEGIFVEDVEITQELTFDFEVADNTRPNDVKIGECLLCRGIVKAVKEIDQVKRALSKACSKVHSNHCQSFVNKHFNQLVDLISNGSKRGKVCKLIMVCSTRVDLENNTQNELASGESFIPEPENIELGPIEVEMDNVPQITLVDFDFSNFDTVDKKKIDCTICKAVVSGIKALVKSDFSQNKIKDALTKVCSKLHKFGSKCQHFIDAYAGKLVELLTNAATRGKVCRLIKLCAVDVSDEPNGVEKGFAEDDMEHVPQITEEEAQDSEVVDNEIIIPEPNNDQVKRALSKACSKVHSNHCQSFVNKHFNQLVDLISNGSKRGKVCKLIMVCSTGVDLENNGQNELASGESFIPEPENIELGPIEVEMDDVPQITLVDFDFSNFDTVDKKKIDCTICKAVVSGIKALVKSDFSQNKIRDALTKVCSKLHKFGSKCQHFVDAYAGKLVELLTNAATRGKVCRLIKLCAVDVTDEPNDVEKGFAEDDMEHVPQITEEEAQDSEVVDNEIIIPEPNNVKIGECLLCRGIVKAVKEIVKHSFTKRGKVCKLIMVCSSGVDLENSPLYGQSLSAQDEPDTVEIDFVEIGVDDAPLVDFEFSNFETIDKKKIDCTICKAVVSGIKALVKSDFSQNKIRDALTKVCSKLHKFGSKCQHFVDAYAGKLVELLTNAATRGKVCRLIKLCAVDVTDESSFIPESNSVEKRFAEDDMEHVPQITGEEARDSEVVDNEIIIPEPNNDQVKRALSKACSKVHSNHCQSFVNKHFNQLVDLISNGSKRGKVCKLIMVCSSGVDLENSPLYGQSLSAQDEPDTVEIDFVEIGVDDAPLVDFEFSNFETIDKKKIDCTICKAVVSGIKALVNSDFSQNKIRDALTKVCSKLHKFGSKCQHFVDAYAGKLVELLTNAATRGKVCRLIKLCAVDVTDESSFIPESNSVEKRFAEDDMEHVPQITGEEARNSEVADNKIPIPAPNDVKIGECLLCRGIVKAVKEIVKHSFTKDQVKRALSKACSKVHSNHCQSFVNKHFIQLVDLISNGSKRGKVCKLIMVCSTEVDLENSPLYEANYESLIRDPNSVEIGSVEVDSELVNFDFSNFETVDKKKFDCSICKAVVSGIKALVKSDFSQNKIKDALTKVCSKYHTFGANKCQQFVHAYSGKLVELLTNAATRGKVCKLLKLCPTHDSLAEEKEIFVDLEMGIAEDDNMGSNSQIIQGLTFDFEVADNRININDVKIGECLLCRGIVKAVKEIVKHSFTKDQVKRALSKACSKVHSNHCQSFVNKHFNQLVDLISDGSKRGKVCKLILVCSTGVDLENNAQNELANDISEPDNTEIDSFETDMENFPQITLEQLLDFFGTVDKKKIDCTICKAVVSGIKALVKSDFSQNKIKDALTKVCSKLHKFGSKCQHFVDAYAGKLVELLTNSATRGKVCRLLKLCAVDDITDEIHFIPELYSMEKGLLVEDDMESNSPITLEPTFDFDNGSITSYDECLACRSAVTGAVYIIGKDFTKDKVRHVLLGMKEICEVYKKTDFGCSRFLSLINKYLDKLVDLIANDKTRLDTCMILKWCRFRDNYGNFENFDLQQIFLDNLWHQNYYGLEKDDECLICKNIIHAILQYVRRDVTKENIQHIINAFEHICKANKEISPYCPTLLKIVEKYSNKLAGLIVNKTTRNKVCEIFKLCQKSTLEPPNVETRLSTRKDKVCNVCEIIVFTVIKLTKHDPTNKTKIEDALEIFENYCQIRNEDPACPTYLDILKNYSDKMVILIQDIKTQRKTCNILKLCPGNQMIEYPHPIKENAIDDAELESYIFEDNGFEKNHDECFICRATVCGIVQIVKQDFTKDKIRHILTSLKHLCEKREKNVPDCRKYLNLLRKHYDKFVDLIADEKTRFKACSILKICPTTTEDGLLNFSDQDLQQSILVNLMEQQQSFEKDYGVSPCQPCQFAISILKSFALNPRVVALVHEQLTKLCNLMFVSPQLRNICHNQINWYWASLLNLIRTLQENQICHIVKLCNTPHEELMDYDVAKVGTSMCNICQMSLSLIKSLAQNNHFARLIHDTLNNSCNLLVSPYLISMCHSEIRTHWLTWLGTLEHFQEAQVCQTIEMCHARQIYDDNNNASDRCEACKGISHLVKFIFKIPNFKTRVHAGINKICDILPLEFGSICHAEVNINWQKWMTLLQTIPDGKLCHKVNMCP
ncbi:unnamed protein product [Ceutorhynchus assimilis]|uniref:Saposin B-type domain-containing protein n=1 Tax=Ceutorhynchus assimilis TaxID=467358 RepID=A0A9N9QPV3_9CUCU|nr:unnamed protein product [Ceutorhynchus assimilis]